MALVKDYISELPLEIITKIFEYIPDLKDLLSFSQTSKWNRYNSKDIRFHWKHYLSLLDLKKNKEFFSVWENIFLNIELPLLFKTKII